MSNFFLLHYTFSGANQSKFDEREVIGEVMLSCVDVLNASKGYLRVVCPLRPRANENGSESKPTESTKKDEQHPRCRSSADHTMPGEVEIELVLEAPAGSIPVDLSETVQKLSKQESNDEATIDYPDFSGIDISVPAAVANVDINHHLNEEMGKEYERRKILMEQRISGALHETKRIKSSDGSLANKHAKKEKEAIMKLVALQEQQQNRSNSPVSMNARLKRAKQKKGLVEAGLGSLDKLGNDLNARRRGRMAVFAATKVDSETEGEEEAQMVDADA